jgi:hypothetical protein
MPPADWKDVDAYYAGSSSAKRIPKVSIPLLCIQAADDPIAPEEAIPYEAVKQNPNCTLVVTPCGGHLGWAAGPGAPFSEPWTDAAVVEWLTSVHAQLQQQKAGQAGLTAAQQARQANSTAGRNRADDDDSGSNGNGSSGSNGGAQPRELEAAAGRSNSNSSALTVAVPLSRQASSSSNSSGSSGAFISPVSSAASSSNASRLATAGSSDTSSVVSVRSRCQQQQKGIMLAAGSSEPADLMEQMWWGEGASRALSHSVSAPARPQQHQQQRVTRHSRLSGDQRLAVDAAAAPAQTAPVVTHTPALHQQGHSVRASPFAAAAAAATAAAVEPAHTDAVAVSAPGQEEGVVATPSQVTAGVTAVCEPSPPAAPASVMASAAIDQAQAELWQSVRWAF